MNIFVLRASNWVSPWATKISGPGLGVRQLAGASMSEYFCYFSICVCISQAPFVLGVSYLHAFPELGHGLWFRHAPCQWSSLNLVWSYFAGLFVDVINLCFVLVAFCLPMGMLPVLLSPWMKVTSGLSKSMWELGRHCKKKLHSKSQFS